MYGFKDMNESSSILLMNNCICKVEPSFILQMLDWARGKRTLWHLEETLTTHATHKSAGAIDWEKPE